MTTFRIEIQVNEFEPLTLFVGNVAKLSITLRKEGEPN